mmetsp:Transcript_1281/g.3156  ORF Transcript_1281/g.3156 Transcript_1281/m.3156 type:complete len:396 (+) Transcript_1281:148-1335(+)|eukprot:CAMPEP_0171492570 /NCGR_PEP_ID=MMETSP0958-20121227/4483_1 /TAXON_ID=87120 /ORGANISM="Aurantiochytrium limacinum, Strain ATCCMYA-1381" /LENGTH=395 /DNA_ID=CAMNT_0012026103 /DNA_START=92 /DNA_END=1279 /DNA_ORIENTATION=+
MTPAWARPRAMAVLTALATAGVLSAQERFGNGLRRDAKCEFTPSEPRISNENASTENGASFEQRELENDEAPKQRRLEAAERVAALAGEPFVKLEILRNKPLGLHTRIVRFKLPEGTEQYPYEFGDIVNVRALSFDVDESYAFGKRLLRSYIPLQPLDRKGHMDIIVKTYPYPDGDTGRYLAARKQGEFVEVSLHAQPRVHAKVNPHACSTIVVLSAGSGLTAGIQLVRTMLQHDPSLDVAPVAEAAKSSKESPSGSSENNSATLVEEVVEECAEVPIVSRPRIKILSSDKTMEDMFYIRELDRLVAEYPEELTVFRTLTREVPAKWDQGVGRMSADMLADQLGATLLDPHAKIVVCGPPGFVHHLTGSKTLRPKSIGGVLGQLGCTDPSRVIIL